MEKNAYAQSSNWHFNLFKNDKGSFFFNTVQALQRMQKKKECEIKQFFRGVPQSATW